MKKKPYKKRKQGKERFYYEQKEQREFIKRKMKITKSNAN